MVIHETVRVATPPIPLDHVRQHSEEGPAVGVIADDPLLRIATTRHVVDGAGKFEAEMTCHEGRLAF